MVKPGAAQQELLVQFVKFGIVGVIGFLVDYGVLSLGVELGLGLYVGRLVSFLCAATTTWFCNRLFTFRGKGSGHAGVQWAKFVVASAGGFVLNYGTYAALVTYSAFVRNHLILAVAAGSIAGMFFNFFAARKVVFK